MTTAATPDDFTDVFSREEPSISSDRDRGADTAAPVDGPARDEQGRFAPRDPEPTKPETQAQQPAPRESTPQPTPEADQAKQPRHVPLPELLSEREKRQQEARLREEAERRARDLESRVAEYERLIQQQRQQQVQEQAPDPWSDPKGALEWQQQQMTRQLQQQQAQFQQQLLLERSNISEVRAREKWGDEVVTAAEQAAINAGYAAYFLQQRDPYAALMKWHRSSSFMAKVGDDPDKYEKEIEKRAYEKALADLRAGKAPGSAAPQRFPGSLADATSSSNGTGAVLTDEAIAHELFDSNRDRRRA
jgi:hypothetical protein